MADHEHRHLPGARPYTPDPFLEDRREPSADGLAQPIVPTEGPAPSPGSDSPLAHAPAQAKSTAARAIREIVETLVLAFLIFVAVRALVLNFRVDGSSMVPNLHNGEMLLVNRNAYLNIDINHWLDALPIIERDTPRVVFPFGRPERGDIVVFIPPVFSEKPYIKRVIGLPGETVEIGRDGYVYINGQRLEEPYIQGGITDCNPPKCSWTVPGNSVFVLGDNRRNSSDSRIFGPVPIDSIIGKAWLTYWPPRDFGLVPHYDYPEIRD